MNPDERCPLCHVDCGLPGHAELAIKPPDAVSNGGASIKQARAEELEAEVARLRALIRDELPSRLFAMGASEEREACAQLLEAVGEKEKRQSYSTATFWAANSLLRGARLIRERGESLDSEE